MRFVTRLTSFALMVTFSCFCGLGCGSDGSGTGGVGGPGGAGGFGGEGMGGMGGMGGADVRTCVTTPRDCNDEEPCTDDLCIEQVCVYESLPDDTVCGSATGLSACLSGECQLIWPSCTDEGAEEGDFCQPNEDVERIGRCEAETCEVGPCEIGFDCWDGNACTVGICDASGGTCSQGNAPNGTACIPPAGGQCIDGACESGGAGGQGGAGGRGGAGGQGGG